MFDHLSSKLTQTLRSLAGRSKLTERNIQETLQIVEEALLDADVALPVIKKLMEQVREQALGKKVMRSLKPSDALIEVVHLALLDALGGKKADLYLKTKSLTVILMAGLQGSGKTTTTAKLANLLKGYAGKRRKVSVVSTDTIRPGATQQLALLAEQVGVHYFQPEANLSAVAIAKAALHHATIHATDVLIIDTAGRLSIDSEMMREIAMIHQTVNPSETLFVVDSMTGQDAAHSARAFSDVLPLTGVVLTKIDGDARGGAALSVSYITQKPIKFVGTGEKIDKLEVFHPERMASRILGMGDILSLVEEAKKNVDRKRVDRLAKKLARGRKFNLEDFRLQLQQMQKMGGISEIMKKMPGMGNVPALAQKQVNNNMFVQMLFVIDSMTLKERRYPHIINGSRRRRIANGSGVSVQFVSTVLRKFAKMEKMMQKAKGGGMKKLLAKMQGKLPEDLLT